MARKYKIKHFYDIVDRSDFRANPDYKGVCHIAMAQEGHCLPGTAPPCWGWLIRAQQICWSAGDCMVLTPPGPGLSHHHPQPTACTDTGHTRSTHGHHAPGSE